MAPDEFCCRVDDYVRAVFNRPDQIRRRKGRIHYQRQSVAVGDAGDSIDVRDVRIRIPQSFNKNRLGVVLNGRLYGCQISRVHKSRPDAGCLGQCVGQQIVRAAVYGLGRNDVLAGLCQSRNGVINGRRPGSHCQRRSAPFQRSHSLFENALSGICQPSVNVPRIPETESVRRMIRIVENIRRSSVDWHRPGVRRRIRLLLPYLHLPRLKSPVFTIFDIFHFYYLQFIFSCDSILPPGPAPVQYLKMILSNSFYL